jgi:predicted GNAT family acetyltransferase
VRSQRVHACDRVAAGGNAAGRLRAAEPAEETLVMEWGFRFWEEAGVTEGWEESRRLLRERLAERQLFVWDDGRPTSLAGLAGPTRNGVRVGPVYTPTALRNRGYATACVAALTRQALGAGRRYCFLYTDLANPVSNRIYARIGYRPVIDAQEWAFGRKAEGGTTEARP